VGVEARPFLAEEEVGPFHPCLAEVGEEAHPRLHRQQGYHRLLRSRHLGQGSKGPRSRIPLAFPHQGVEHL